MNLSHPRLEPALYLQIVNAVVAALLAAGILTNVWAQAIGIAASAAVTIITAALTRPVAVAAILGGIQTLLTAVALVYHPASHTVMAVVLIIVTAVVGALVRVNATPEVKARTQVAG